MSNTKLCGVTLTISIISTHEHSPRKRTILEIMTFSHLLSVRNNFLIITCWTCLGTFSFSEQFITYQRAISQKQQHNPQQRTKHQNINHIFQISSSSMNVNFRKRLRSYLRMHTRTHTFIFHNVQLVNTFFISEKIDKDLSTSKKLLDRFQNPARPPSHHDHTLKDQLDDARQQENKRVVTKITQDQSIDNNTDTTNESEAQKLTIILKGRGRHESRTNRWSLKLDSSKNDTSTTAATSTTEQPWRIRQRTPYIRNLAYHRVTGNPVPYRPGMGSNPKAYIAVSVIAPKRASTRTPDGGDADDEIMLENELRQLKPWTHDQNLKNMASLRSRWVIRSDDSKAPFEGRAP